MDAIEQEILGCRRFEQFGIIAVKPRDFLVEIGTSRRPFYQSIFDIGGAEKISALRTVDYLREEAAKGSRADLLAV